MALLFASDYSPFPPCPRLCGGMAGWEAAWNIATVVDGRALEPHPALPLQSQGEGKTDFALISAIR